MALPIRTDRLTLSVLTAADRAAFVGYRRDPDVARWQSWSPIYTDADAPVARLLARLGFRHEGRQVDADWFKGEWTSLDTWAMLRRDR